jgi:hypothetical protein
MRGGDLQQDGGAGNKTEELADGMGRSMDAVTGTASPYRKSRLGQEVDDATG